jgi:hypothetical protein
MSARYSPERPNGPFLNVGSVLPTAVPRGTAGLQPGLDGFCRAAGVHGELEAGSSPGAGGIAALLGGGETATENLRDAAGDLGGGGDNAYLGVLVRGCFRGVHDDLVV